ncbi:MAG: hypothetical protein WBP03_05250 [Candidatus Saccharimonadales bacterium]
MLAIVAYVQANCYLIDTDLRLSGEILQAENFVWPKSLLTHSRQAEVHI